MCFGPFLPDEAERPCDPAGHPLDGLVFATDEFNPDTAPKRTIVKVETNRLNDKKDAMISDFICFISDNETVSSFIKDAVKVQEEEDDDEEELVCIGAKVKVSVRDTLHKKARKIGKIPTFYVGDILEQAIK